MAQRVPRRSVSLAIILMLIASGVMLMASPVQAEEMGSVYSADVSATEVTLDMKNAPPSYYAAATFDVGGNVTVVIRVLLGALVTEVLRSDFPAGSFEVSRVSLGSGGSVFLSVESESGSFIQMSADAWIFHYLTTYPYSWAGLAVFVFAGLFALATEFPNTSFGKIARMILPVDKLGL
jgi:hypothetical protein